jgi:hypothetical protein
MKKLTALLIGLALLGSAATAKADSVILSSDQMDRVTAGHLDGVTTLGRVHKGWYWRWYNNRWHRVYGDHFWPYYYGKFGFKYGFKKTPTQRVDPPAPSS